MLSYSSVAIILFFLGRAYGDISESTPLIKLPAGSKIVAMQLVKATKEKAVFVNGEPRLYSTIVETRDSLGPEQRKQHIECVFGGLTDAHTASRDEYKIPFNTELVVSSVEMPNIALDPDNRTVRLNLEDNVYIGGVQCMRGADCNECPPLSVGDLQRAFGGRFKIQPGKSDALTNEKKDAALKLLKDVGAPSFNSPQPQGSQTRE